MLAGVPWRWFRDWIAYDRVSPIGDDRADMRQAALACWLAGAMAGADEVPSLMYPYWPSDEDRAKELQAREASRVAHRRAYGYED